MAESRAARSIFLDAERCPEPHRLRGPVVQRRYLIGGEVRDWNGPMEEVLSPIWREDSVGPAPRPIGSYPRLTEKESLDALQSAVRACDRGRGQWPTSPVGERLAHLEQFTHRMIECREEVVRLLMWEIAKTLPDAQKEFDRTVQYIRDTIEAVKELDRASSRFSIQEGIIAQIRRAPMGVTLCMGPFNYPLNETFTTLIPALVMGNCVIMKPPKLGVLLHGPLLEAFRDSFPPGVINTVYGPGSTVIPPLIGSGAIDVLAFIGTSAVADTLRRQHPRPHRLRCVLGLEAKNPGVILPDADLELAVRESALGSLAFNGQRCTALKILFCHRSRFREFVDRFAASVDALAAGLPWEQGVTITPLPEPGKPERLRDLVEEAVARGARVANRNGGAVHGSLFMPAVLEGVVPGARLYEEEQFGPVVPIVAFDRIDEPIRYVEESSFGQQISIFGNNPEEIARLIDPLVNQVCRVNLNSQCQRGPDTFPFTGRKDSAEGTLSVSDALRVFSIRTLVAAKGNEGNKAILTDIVRGRRSSFLSTDFIF